MFCPNCGAAVDERDRFCRACGKRLTSEQENVLYSFGPLGVSICYSRPGLSVWTQKNKTRIILTDQQICGYSTFPHTGSPVFQIPYNAILSTEMFRYFAGTVLWIQYLDEKKARREVSIICSLFNSYHITNANELLQTHRST